MGDLISRQDAIDALDVLCQEHRYKIPGKRETYSQYNEAWQDALGRAENAIGNLPSAQPERLTDDDFEVIRTHLNAWKERLCNQRRWKEAEEYQRIIDRFMAFASAQSERNKGEWICTDDDIWNCSECDFEIDGTGCIDPEEYRDVYRFCPRCGSDMRGEQDEKGRTQT